MSDLLFCDTVTQLKRKKENIRIVVVTEEALMTFVVGGSHNSHKKSNQAGERGGFRLGCCVYHLCSVYHH